MKDSILLKELDRLESKSSGFKAGFDLNTDYSEIYIEHRKDYGTYDMFGKAYGKAIWNELGVWGDEEYVGGISGGISW